MATEPGRRNGGAVVRIGCGAGFANDRMEPALDLVERGNLDYLFFEGLAERTLAQSQRERHVHHDRGFNPTLERRMRLVLPACRARGTRIVTNMGAANPAGAAAVVLALAREMGMNGLKVGVVEGDDVSHAISPRHPLADANCTVGEVGRALIGANAYLGAEPIVVALDEGADIVITGRVADPSLVVAPLMHHFGWSADDWQRLGAATMIGHLLECGFQITGGYFADPGRKDVPGLARLGYPIAEVAETGDATITKLTGTGGTVTRETVLEQLLYEVHDPAAYLTPDVSADFSAAQIVETGVDRVAVTGGNGRARPENLKVTIGYDGGFRAEAGISYAGSGALSRARLAASVLAERMRDVHGLTEPLRTDLIGYASLHATAGAAYGGDDDHRDIRLHATLISRNEQHARALVDEMEGLWIAGPAGGGGVRGQVMPTIMTRTAFIGRESVRPKVEILVA